MPFTIIRNDITKLRVDAIVNAANTTLLMGGGVCGAIFRAAGAERLQTACDRLAPIKTGQAVITPGFDIPAKYIIHTAGPFYEDGQHGEETLLRACYLNSLELAARHNCESIAFPSISTGIYGYPKTEAFRIATAAIRAFLSEHDIAVSLVVFEKESFAVNGKLRRAVESYIGEHYIDEDRIRRRKSFDVGREVSAYTDATKLSALPLITATNKLLEVGLAVPESASLEDLVGNLDEPFSATLLRLIDATGKKDSEIYNRANIDRRLFSKIRSNAHYAPSKPTVLAFAVALELNLEQTEDLLERAGFALSHSRKLDVIVEYFIRTRLYDIYEINEVLFSYDQPLLGG